MRRRHLTRGMASVLAVGGLLVSAAQSGAQAAVSPAAESVVSAGPPVRLTAQAPPARPVGAVWLGPLAAGTRVHLDVTLKVRDQAALTAFLADVSNRASPLFHHFLRRGQFGPRFGPTLATVMAVRTVLRRAGLTPGRVASNRLAIPVTATAAAVERAFRVPLVSYRLPGGRVAYANTRSPSIASGVARYVAGIIGLDDLQQAQSMAVQPPAHARLSGHGRAGTRLRGAPDTSGPQPCAAASKLAKNGKAYTANELASHYYMSPFYGLGDLGAGIRVALVEVQANSMSDITEYESCYGVSTPVSYHKVDGGAPSGTSAEPDLDIEDVIGLAPKSPIDVYQSPDSDAGLYDQYDAIVTADNDPVISTSVGLCELLSSSTYLTEEQPLFEQANAQQQTVFAAAGDQGSTACDGEGGDSSALAVLDPASQPYVISVGGTTLKSSGETVWNDSSIGNGAGGGGVSTVWCMPSYQYEYHGQAGIPGLISKYSKKKASCPAAQGRYLRQVPDVTADGDPQTGYVIYFDGKWKVEGGTSAAAPLWAAVAALIDASPFCKDWRSGNAGVLPQGLYKTAWDFADYGLSNYYPHVLSDITNGNNDYTPSGYKGGKYPATSGYDMASGLGAPQLSGLTSAGTPSMFNLGLAAAMCWVYATIGPTVTGITPHRGPTSGGTTVTVTGSGFLAISGADLAVFSDAAGETDVAAKCSTTTCTTTTPAHAAGTVDIEIWAEDPGQQSLPTTADQFTYTG